MGLICTLKIQEEILFTLSIRYLDEVFSGYVEVTPLHFLYRLKVLWVRKLVMLLPWTFCGLFPQQTTANGGQNPHLKVLFSVSV